MVSIEAPVPPRVPSTATGNVNVLLSFASQPQIAVRVTDYSDALGVAGRIGGRNRRPTGRVHRDLERAAGRRDIGAEVNPPQ